MAATFKRIVTIPELEGKCRDLSVPGIVFNVEKVSRSRAWCRVTIKNTRGIRSVALIFPCYPGSDGHTKIVIDPLRRIFDGGDGIQDVIDPLAPILYWAD